MKVEIEVYDLNQELVTIKNNRIRSFRPQSLRIMSVYQGYTGGNWGESDNKGRGGWPFIIQYSEQAGPTVVEESWTDHKDLFPTKADLLKTLSDDTESKPDI